MNQFNFNGKSFPEGTPVLGASSRGLRYGDGVFETIKCFKGQLQLSDLHFARLWKGMGMLQFKMPRHLTPESLTEEILKLAGKNGHLSAARIRLTVFRGEGGLYDPVSHQPEYLIQTWGLHTETEALNSNGLVLGIYPDQKKSTDPFSNLKHNNFLPYVMAALHAKSHQWNDAILLNTSDRLCDTTMANIFLVKDGLVITPPLSEGCVAGTVREHLLKRSPELGLDVVERPVTADEMLQADEVFLTNAIHPLRWVQSIGDSRYGNTILQKIYTALVSTID